MQKPPAKSKEADEPEGGGVGQLVTKGLTYAGLILLGFVVGICIGYINGAGMASILGVVTGVSVFGCIAWVVTGDMAAFFRTGSKEVIGICQPLVPSIAHQSVYGHSTFSLLVTIHTATLARSGGISSGKVSNLDIYAVLEVGVNPPKSTCVRDDGVFEETFKVKIRPRDHMLYFCVKDQEVVMDRVIGKVEVSVASIIESGFPVQYSFMATDWKGVKSAVLVLSFDWCDDFPQHLLQDAMQRNPAEFERRKALRDQSLSTQQDLGTGNAYGTFATAHATTLFHPTRGP